MTYDDALVFLMIIYLMIFSDSHLIMTKMNIVWRRNFTDTELHNLMKTDIREKKGSYVLDIDLPGFKKDELTIELNDGYLTISAAKGLEQDKKKKKPDIISVVNVMPVPAREVSMLVRM